MTCYEGNVRVNDTIRVVASAATTAGGCDASVGVLFLMVFDAVDQIRPPEPRIPSALSTSNIARTHPHRLFIKAARRGIVNVFAYNVESIILDVAQTGYDCSRSSRGYCTRPAVQIVVGSSVLQQCGGSLPFLRNVSGTSDQCAQPRFCGMPVFLRPNTTVDSDSAGSSDLQSEASSLFADGSAAASGVFASAPLVNSSAFAGWIQLTMDIATIRSASSLCQYFQATLFASTFSGERLSGFVLHKGRGSFSVLAAPRRLTAQANATATLPDTVRVPALGKVLGEDDARDVYLVNLSTFFSSMKAPPYTASFACVMDWISTDSGICTVPVPPGANYVTVKVAQTNFVDTSSQMFVQQLDSSVSSALLDSAKCGGPLGFSGLPSLSEQCTTFLPCGSGFLDSSAAYVQLVVPESVGNSGTCDVAFAATIDFQFINRTTPAACPFLCARDRTCVAQSVVCDGVADCADGSDESGCNTWSQIESNNIFALTADTLTVATRVFSDCRLAALKNGTNVFAMAKNQSRCILYPRSRAANYLVDPSPFIIPMPNFVTFAALTDKTTYGRCTSESSCNGNGQVVESRAGGKLSCSCVCNPGYTSGDCSTRMELGTPGPIVVSFSIEDSVPTPNQVEAALMTLSNTSDVASLSISCSPLVNSNGKLSATCAATGPASDIAGINAAVTTDSARAKVAAALNISVSSLDPMTPSTQPLLQAATCGSSNSTDGGGSSLCSTGGRAVKSIRASVTASSGVDGITLNLALAERSQMGRHFSSQSTSTLRCLPDDNNLYQTPTRSGCVTTVCFVSISDPSPIDSVTVTTPTYTGNASTDPCYSVGMEFTVPLLITNVVQTYPQKASDNFSPFLISGVLVLIIGGLLLAVASVALRRYIAETSAAVGDVPSGHALKSMLTVAIRKMKFNHSRNFRAERWSTTFAVVSFDLLVLGIFLSIYFVNSSGYTSNVEVLLENYRTGDCDKSTFAPLASRVTIVPASSARQCMQRESTGITSGSIYAASYCENSTGVLTIQVKIGSSLSDCNAMPFTPFPAGSCIRTSLLLTHVNDSSYLLFQCGTAASVAARFAAFQALNDDSADVDTAYPQVLSKSLAQPNPRTVPPFNMVYLSTRISQAAASNISSLAPNRYESAAAGGTLVAGDAVRERLVVQIASDVFDANTPGYATAAVEGLSPLKSVDSRVSALGPIDGDYPVGFLYNNFNLPGEASLFSAGPGAGRYYGIQGTLADIGRFYTAGAQAGFTISMYLRCSRSSAGFAFAVTDAREDVVTGLSPLLTRLMAMLANGSPGSAWYNSTYSVYSALFVDGPAAALHFVFVNPSRGSELVDLQWDMSDLGLLRLFNNVWHHVAIIIRTENQNTKVQLVVDGVTSLSQSGWNLCTSRTPWPIQGLDPATEIPVRNFQAERVLTEGVLFTGYFNGGIAHLQFTDEKVSLFDLWRFSTSAIQQHNAINTVQYIALGSVLLAVGAAMITALLFTSGREWVRTELTMAQDEERHAQDVYHELWHREPKDSQGVLYVPLPWSLALSTMGCSIKTMSVFLDELRFNFKHPPEELVRLLYAKATAGTGTVDSSIPQPSAEQWALLLPEEGDEPEDNPDAMLDVVVSDNHDPDEAEHDTSPGTKDSDRWSPNTCSNPQFPLAPSKAARRSHSERVVNSRKSVTISGGGEDGPVPNRRTGHGLSAASRQVKGANVHMTKGDLGIKAVPGGSRTGARSSSVNDTVSTSELIQSILGVIQSVSVWQTSLPFPTAHLVTFQTAFAAFSLDFTSLVNISPLVTPLVQLFIGLVVFGVLLFVVESDEKAFLWNLARYVVMRDSIDNNVPVESLSQIEGDYMSEVTPEFESMLGEVPDNGLVFAVPLLPVRQAQKIDDFVSGDRRLTISSARAIMVHDVHQNNFTLQKPPGARDDCPVSFLYVKSSDTQTTPLRLLGHCCTLHTHRVLGPQLQTTVWPYKYRPSCCVETHGHRCGVSVGKMFVCGHVEENSGQDVQCKYAVCEKHFRAPLRVTLMIPFLGLFRAAMQRGVLWLVVTVFLVLANACYTPFMKTALMILACDPYYQCQFQHCWEAPDRLFILAAYLCLVIVTFYGVGFPLSMSVLLHRRKKMLNEIFFSDVYGGRFEDPSEPGQVDMNEWRRFVVTDPTALGKLYLSFELDWIHLPPILLFWKAVVLAPAVFIERNTFPQLAGVAAAQFLFGMFLFVTEPSISPIVDLMYKLGAAHQMLLLGILSLNTRQQYEGSTDLGPLSVAITVTYLFISAVIVGGVTLVPVLNEMLEERLVIRLLSSLGMHYSKAIGMYVAPVKKPHFSATAEGTSLHDTRKDEQDTTTAFEASRLCMSAIYDPSASMIKRSHDLERSRHSGSAVHLASMQTEEKNTGLVQREERNELEGDELVSEDEVFSEPVEDGFDLRATLCDLLVRGIVEAHESDELNTLQRRLLLAILSGKDCLVTAPAGTGKSTAAAIAALHCIDFDKVEIQSVVVCSTPESAARFMDQLKILGRHMSREEPFVMLFDGTNRTAADILYLQHHPREARLVVGTLRGLQRLATRGILNVSRAACMFIDDADEFLGVNVQRKEDIIRSESCIDGMQTLHRLLPTTARIAILASTMSDKVREEVASTLFLKKPVEITITVSGHPMAIESTNLYSKPRTSLKCVSLQNELTDSPCERHQDDISSEAAHARGAARKMRDSTQLLPATLLPIADLDVDFEVPQ